MKKLKLSLQHLSNAEVLTRQQLKSVLGGEGSGSDNTCQGWHEACDTSKKLNCCTGYVCADYQCWIGTL